MSTQVTVGQSVDWVVGSEWNLIAANDSTRSITRKATTGQVRKMGDYPAGATNIQAITGAPVAGAVLQKLKIYVIHGSWPNIVMQAGTHDRFVQPSAITWEYTTTPAGPYSHGLNYAYDGTTSRVFRIVDYIESHFHWFTPASPYTTGYELGMNGSPNYTDHTYAHPEGELDRFAPIGFDMDPANGYFYGVDQYYNNETARSANVVARLSRSRLRF